MSEMGAADFKAHCLQVMETVRRTRRPVTITKRGIPVVQLIPAPPRRKLALGTLAGKFTSAGDIVSSPLSDAERKATQQDGLVQWEKWTRGRGDL